MNISEVINVNDKYLRAPDLKGRKFSMRIESYSVEDFQERKQIVLKFHGAKKVLGLNKTNTRMIASMYGDETDAWIGQEVVLYPTKTSNQNGQLVDCIRVEYQAPAQTARALAPRQAAPQRYDERNPPPHTEVPADDMDDEIPF